MFLLALAKEAHIEIEAENIEHADRESSSQETTEENPESSTEEDRSAAEEDRSAAGGDQSSAGDTEL